MIDAFNTNNCLIMRVGGCQAIVLIGLGAWVGCNVGNGVKNLTGLRLFNTFGERWAQ